MTNHDELQSLQQDCVMSIVKGICICALWVEDLECDDLSICTENAMIDAANTLYHAFSDHITRENAEQYGHDLWLTSSGHGTAFWDRPEQYPNGLHDELTDYCNNEKLLGPCEAYKGDDGLVYLSGFEQ